MRSMAFLLSCLLAYIGGHMVNYSIIFLALEWFNSPALAGIGYGLCFGPPLILGWLAGVYCDRYSPRWVILIAQNSFIFALLLLYPALTAEPQQQQILLLCAAGCSGIGWSFVAPARFATLPFYVSPSQLPGAAIALNLMVMAGFGLAPVLLKQLEVHYGWTQVLTTSASLFVLSSLILLPLKFDFKAKAGKQTIKEIKRSLSFVAQTPQLNQLLLLAAIGYLLMGPMQVLLPGIAKDLLGLDDSAQGYYLSLIAVSLIIGGLAAMSLKNNTKVGHTLLLAMLLAGVGLAWLAGESQLAVSVSVLMLAGVCGGIAISFIVAGLQAFSPSEHRGRVMSFYAIISQVIPALSGIVAGLTAQWFNPTIALQLMAALIVAAVLVSMLLLVNIRQLESFEHA